MRGQGGQAKKRAFWTFLTREKVGVGVPPEELIKNTARSEKKARIALWASRKARAFLTHFSRLRKNLKNFSKIYKKKKKFFSIGFIDGDEADSVGPSPSTGDFFDFSGLRPSAAARPRGILAKIVREPRAPLGRASIFDARTQKIENFFLVPFDGFFHGRDPPRIFIKNHFKRYVEFLDFRPKSAVGPQAKSAKNRRAFSQGPSRTRANF